MPRFEFHYFDGYGRSEPIRILMNYKNVDHQDCRVPFNEWPGTLKEELGGTALPVIKFQDGRKFNQAQSIMRYIGMKTGCYPTDPAVAYDNDRICEDWNDYINVLGGVFFVQEPAAKA